MDDTDRRLLNIIQAGFPIRAHPYDAIGEQLGISADGALRRVRKLAESGVIRRIGASFDTRKLGHVDNLVAAKVQAEQLEKQAALVSSFPEVTHNYAREGAYNLWFTLVCESLERIEEVLESIKSGTGISEMFTLPAERMFKIKVDFQF